MLSEKEYEQMSKELEKADWFQMPFSGKWVDPKSGTQYFTESAYKIMKQDKANSK